MGNTVWILQEGEESDDWDHSLILKFEKSLNKLSKELGIPKLSEFYDSSILSEEMGFETEPKYCEPSDLETVFSKLINAIKNGDSAKLSGEDSLLNELKDCHSKIIKALESGHKVRLAVVP